MEKVITKVEVQKRNKNRANIYLDGEFAFSCSLELAVTYKLNAKKVVEIEKLKEVIAEDNYLKCKNAALKIIEKTYKTEKEIFDKLILKGYDEKTISKALNFLKSYNFLNDDAYIDMYIKDKIKVQGKNKIKYSLLRKGIDEHRLEEKLNKIDSETEIKAALSLGEKKYRLLIKSEKDKKKISRKVWEYLMRNGYDSSIINEVLNKVVNLEDKEESTQEVKADFEEIYNLAFKRYNIISKRETDSRKIYKKLSDFLLRKGYSYEDIKNAVSHVLKNENMDEY